MFDAAKSSVAYESENGHSSQAAHHKSEIPVTDPLFQMFLQQSTNQVTLPMTSTGGE